MSQKSKLYTITTSYNSFVKDQVLTHNQLNQIIDYFGDQNRMTRIRLSGTGIACGFNLSFPSESDVSGTDLTAGLLTLSQGTGVTTDGDLIYNTLYNEEEGVTAYQTFCNGIQFEKYIDHNDEKSDYFADRLSAYTEGQILELVPTHKVDQLPSTITPSDFVPETFSGPAGTLENYVFVIYLEYYTQEDGACTSTSCEVQGAEEPQNLRYLLVSVSDIQEIIAGTTTDNGTFGPDTNYTEKKSYETLQDSMKKLQVKRLIFHDGTSLLPADTSAQVATYYYNAINNGSTLSDLTTGFDAMCDKMGLASFASDISGLLSFSSGSIPDDVQYRFDLFKDLVETYNEARDLIMHIDTYCCPALNAFPKHLMVSGFTRDETGTNTGIFEVDFDSEYRHSFYESPIVGHERTTYEKVLSLLNRAATLAAGYLKDSKGDTIKITPSNLQGELGTKAIPFYYSHTEDLIDTWNFEKTSSRIQNTNLSYNTSLLSSEDAIQNPLSYSIDENDFYRIEGHLGMDVETVIAELENMKLLYGLDFDIVEADVAETVPTLTELIEKAPSLTHLAGVPKGGTFILAAENDLVFADFALDSKLEKKVESEGVGLGCCPIVECSYPWISSLKYINNLSRSLNGTQSDIVEMPEYYTLAIWEYEINGTSLKTRVKRRDIIQIPLEDIFLRRMHAVTEALNDAYPQGLVFDFNESQKRLTITRPKNDQFRFAVQDITLEASRADSEPRYLYTNSGFYKFIDFKTKKTCIVLPDAMVCRDLLEYNPELYENLQIKYAPINKDDDYQAYKYLWEEMYALRDVLIDNTIFAEWKQVRFIKAQEQLPYDEQVMLYQVLGDLNKTSELIQTERLRQALADTAVDTTTTDTAANDTTTTDTAAANDTTTTTDTATTDNTTSLKSGLSINVNIDGLATEIVLPTYALDGDWVRGMWVDDRMQEIYEKVRPLLDETDPAKPEVQIGQFVDYKRRLLEDRGRTRMSIYLVGEKYDAAYQPVLDYYSDFADFYFCETYNSISVIPIKQQDPVDPAGVQIFDPTVVNDTYYTRTTASTQTILKLLQ